MATADQYETQLNAIASAVTTLAGYGSSGSGTPGIAAAVTATSTRKQKVLVCPDRGELFRRLERGDMGIRPQDFVASEDGIALVIDTPTETFVVARVKK
jgi:hypothetical protein